ncbi:LuxR C-terminal-related transcriptional regulator [Kribbella sp. NPDC059898]|uniref:LuxR C-terminal-related transcriptional regulator n=1 Tax=Kribbella sp. NPDC059898 TaxID=3346995 RepID=UPI0036638659
MSSSARPEAADSPVGAALTGGIVARRELFARLGKAARITLVSGPAGSGKTLLLRSWIDEAGLADRAVWLPVRGTEREPEQFWLALARALRRSTAGAELVRPLSAAPNLDGGEVAEWLLTDLAALTEQVWLIIDDLHELRSTETLRQLELLLLRAPDQLRLVLATRHDLPLGLHRLRLEGQLTEIRAADLRFTAAEARELLEEAGLRLPDTAVALLHARTEGWAAGLRLAALSLAGHPDPERFAAEFAGSERTVAEYLLAEVLERQSEPVRRMLLRTSLLDRVSGELADQLTGGSGGERILYDLEQANAFVVSLDARRSWFRYHQLFADLLLLELRHAEPTEIPALHRTAAAWFAGHGYPADAIRHAQAAEDWSLAARLLSDRWLGLYLDGQRATVRDAVARFPVGVPVPDGELAGLKAVSELIGGSLPEAERQLALATRNLASLPADRRARCGVLLGLVRLLCALHRIDLPGVDESQRLLTPTGAADAAQSSTAAVARDLLAEQDPDLRAMVLIHLGIAELWTARTDDADRHLAEGVALAHRIPQPYLEVTALAHWAVLAEPQSFALAAERSERAVELARRHGWSEEPVVAVAYAALADTLIWQGRLDDAEHWLERAERTLPAEVQPAGGVMLRGARGMLELARGRNSEALAAFRSAEALTDRLVAVHTLAGRLRAQLLETLVRLGESRQAEAALAALDVQQRDTVEMRTVLAVLRLAQGDPAAATNALAPVLDDASVQPQSQTWVIRALLVEAIARDALRDGRAAGQALERSLELAEANGVLLPFVVHPAPDLLQRHATDGTKFGPLISRILTLVTGTERAAPPRTSEQRLHEPLSNSEVRVLRYLPTNLTAPEIAGELTVSVNTIRTHMRHLYVKLDVHSRADAVKRARTLGLLAPSRVLAAG